MAAQGGLPGEFRRGRHLCILAAIGAGAGVLPTALHLLVPSHASVSSVLLGNVVVISVVAAGVVIHGLRLSPKAAGLAPWLACGSLAGASLIVPLRIGPYLAIAVASLGLVGVLRGVGGARGALVRAAGLLAAAVLNFACLWPFTLGLHRPIAPAPYLALDLRAHTLLADVPLHDVWTAHLSDGGADRTLVDLNDAMAGGLTGDETLALALAVTGYMLAARMLGLARDECVDRWSPVRQRLTDTDRARSLDHPAARGFVYYFEREALLEIQTCTARAYYLFALAPNESGYTLYWGVYADSVSWVTPYYMSLIDPVRRLVVFPSLLQRMETRWRAKWQAGDRRSDAATAGGSDRTARVARGWP